MAIEGPGLSVGGGVGLGALPPLAARAAIHPRDIFGQMKIRAREGCGIWMLLVVLLSLRSCSLKAVCAARQD